MRKKLLIVGGVIVLLVVLVVAVFFNLEGIVNRNKDYLLSRAEAAVGRKVSVDKIGVTLIGGIGVRLENFSIADDPAFSTEPFIQARDLQVNAKLLPLLKKEFEIKRVVLHDPAIRIIRDESGKLNTSTLGGAAATAPADTSAPASGAAAAPLVVSLVNLDGGEIHVVDRMQGLDLRLTQIESRVAEIDFEKPISIELNAAFLSEEKNIAVSGTFGPVGRQMNLENLAMEASLQIDPIEIGPLAQAVPMVGKAMPPGLGIDGPLSFDIRAAGNLPEPGISVRLDATPAGVELPGQFEKAAGVPLVVQADVRPHGQKIVIDRFEARLEQLVATGKGEYHLTTPPTINLSVDAKPTPLAGIGQMLPALKPYGLSGQVAFAVKVTGPVKPGAVPNANGTVTLSDAGARVPQLPKPIRQARSEITLAGHTAKIGKTSLLVGNSRIEGTASVESFKPVTVSYQAASTALSLDDVRPPNPKATKPEVLHNIVVRGRMVAKDTPTNGGDFTSTSGAIANIDYRDLKGNYSIVGPKTTLSDLELRALDGTLEGDGVVTMTDGVPAFEIKTRVDNLNAIMLFEKLPNVTRQFLSGKVNMNLNISGTGTEWKTMRKTISGDGLAELFNGAIVDVNIFNKVLDQLSTGTGATSLVSQNLKDKYPKLFKEKSTQFKDLKSDFVIENGRLLARNLRLNADDYNLVAKGGIDFERNLDFAVTLQLSKKFSDDLVADLNLAKYLRNPEGRVEVPFALSGTLPKARATVDKNFMNKVVQKALVQKGLKALDKKDVKDLFDFGKKKDSAPADTTSKPE